MNRWTRLCLIPVAAAAIVACGETARLPFEAGVGPTPQLPAPNKTFIPTVKVSEAVGWTDTAGPTAPAGSARSASCSATPASMGRAAIATRGSTAALPPTSRWTRPAWCWTIPVCSAD